jgi:hypothetical protein
MVLLDDINNIFLNNLDYNNINSHSSVKLRNIKNGISVSDAILYGFLYSKIDTTKNSVSAHIGSSNNSSFSRQAFDSKESNIQSSVYLSIFNDLSSLFYKISPSSIHNKRFIAVDGTNNNDIHQKIILNMGYFDISNGIPIGLSYCGSAERNREVKHLIQHIQNNPDLFKNTVIVGDRFYFTYDLMNFLVDNKIDFIIRAKGNATNLDKSIPLSNNVSNKDIILKLRNKVRLIHYSDTINKTVFDTRSKKSTNRKDNKTPCYDLEIENDCSIVTTLKSVTNYPDSKILDTYRSRWDIETYFKLIKKNFKCQTIPFDENQNKFDKMFLRILIISVIVEIIRTLLKNSDHDTLLIKKVNGKTVNCTKIINKSLMISGIFDFLLDKIIKGVLNQAHLDLYFKNYVKIIKNATQRTFPRASKRFNSKWYIKKYSNTTKIMRVIDAILNDTIDNLDKNLKIIANKTTIIRKSFRKYKADTTSEG